jgi:hypothetical protein
MVYLTSTLHLLALALIANVARAVPLHHKCETPTYDRFNLYAVTDERVSWLRLVNNGTDVDGNTISTLSVSTTFVFTALSISLTPRGVDMRHMR